MRTTVRSDKTTCTGCGACATVCPKKAITMVPDEEGFLYPKVDQALCISCDLCEKRCPVGREYPEYHPLRQAMQIKDEAIRRESSSGGAFTALARHVLKQGGVVFGASFDENLHVEHVGAFDETELAGMRGSKYVQSDATEAIGNAVSLLKRDIPVLFSGSPCQISGLLAALNGKHMDKLLTVDFVCHGVPSPGVFCSYLKQLEEQTGKKIKSYTFRDKRLGWKDFSAVAQFEDGTEHAGTQATEPYLYGFLQNLYLRPACHACGNLRGCHHPSDITLADLWAAEEQTVGKDDDSGLSYVMANTKKGRKALEACMPQLHAFPIEQTVKMENYNRGLLHAVKPHEKRKAFFARYKKHGFEPERVMKLLAGPSRMERTVKRILHLPVGACRRIKCLLKK